MTTRFQSLHANAHAHRERPKRIPSDSAEPHRGRDAVARIVRWLC